MKYLVLGMFCGLATIVLTPALRPLIALDRIFLISVCATGIWLASRANSSSLGTKLAKKVVYLFLALCFAMTVLSADQMFDLVIINKPPPRLKKAVQITLKVHTDADVTGSFLLTPLEDVLIHDRPVLRVLEGLVRPTRAVEGRWAKSCPHVVDVVMRHADGTETTVFVYHAGLNPALVSLDGEQFFFGGQSDEGDGAGHIIRIAYWDLEDSGKYWNIR